MMKKLFLLANLTFSFSQLRSIARHPITITPLQRAWLHFLNYLKLLPLQAKQAQFPQPLLTGQVLQFLTIVMALC